MLLASKVKAARIYSFGTISRLAEVVDVSNQALLCAEKYDYNSSVATLISICNVTGMPPDWLFDETVWLSTDWVQTVTIGRITKNAYIPESAPWSGHIRTEQLIKIDNTQYGRLSRISKLMGISVDVLSNQLLNEGLSIKEAQLQLLTHDTFDVDLFQAVIDLYKTFELSGDQVRSKEEKIKIIKSVYFDLVAAGTNAEEVSEASLLKLFR